MTSQPPREFRELSKGELHDLIRATKSGNSGAINQAVAFFTVESFGMWHNRARANLCRHFKNHPPGPMQCDQMVETICERLISGNFSEQFTDRLSIAIRFNRDRMQEAAHIALRSDREYIVRYGHRVLHAISSIRPKENG